MSRLLECFVFHKNIPKAGIFHYWYKVVYTFLCVFCVLLFLRSLREISAIQVSRKNRKAISSMSEINKL